MFKIANAKKMSNRKKKHAIYSRCQKKLFILIKEELKIFLNKNDYNQNVVTIHSLDKSFSLLNFQDGPTLTDSAALTD